MPLDYPLMLFKPEGATCVVPSESARDEAIAAGWFLRADAWFLRGDAPPEPVAEPAAAALPSRKPRKVKESA